MGDVSADRPPGLLATGGMGATSSGNGARKCMVYPRDKILGGLPKDMKHVKSLEFNLFIKFEILEDLIRNLSQNVVYILSMNFVHPSFRLHSQLKPGRLKECSLLICKLEFKTS